jgi:ATP-binding cassette, subfamily B, bacterial
MLYQLCEHSFVSRRCCLTRSNSQSQAQTISRSEVRSESRSEFTVQNAEQYDHRSAIRWIFSHLMRNKLFLFGSVTLAILSAFTYSQSRVLIGQAVGEVAAPTAEGALLALTLVTLGVLVVHALSGLGQALTLEVLAQRLEASARKELYASLLGKSQTFHNRQRVGDIMARATDDVVQLNGMVNPGLMFIFFDTGLGILMPMIFIATINVQLLLVPIIFIVGYAVTLQMYSKQLNPISYRLREQFGKVNATLEETISGIEIVKASAQELSERKKFRTQVRLFRDFTVRQGRIEARYLPYLLFGITVGASFLHAVTLYQSGQIDLAGVVAYMGLVEALRFPTFISVFSFSLVQAGIAGGKRIMEMILADTELDENAGGYGETIKGEIVFENVTFQFQDDSAKNTVLEDISFRVSPGRTVAIVGQTGSGKSTLTQLINRTYDTTRGRVLIDGVDVRDWDLTQLRSQISKIEQDVFLFSRSISENIAFGAPGATQEQIEQAAKEAQAHDFILSFSEGYNTVIGERGVTLSGGQRQRLALARAFLSNPRILILDDSTSAIDSATEDEIQKAIRRAQQGRTTLLITHRLSQIRWADHILVIERGKLVASGSHEQLLRTSKHYRRIFARYEVELPPLEVAESAQSVTRG